MLKKKMFNIVAEFELTKKPAWLNNFRKKYDRPYQYHISVKTCTYFNDNDLEKIKLNLENFLKSYKEIIVIFNGLLFNKTSSGWCIMIKAEHNNYLNKLQKEISNEFSKYGKHISEELKKFEINFEPHITIARHLNQEEFNNAKSELKNGIHCEAIINELVFTIAKDDNYKEWINLDNKTFFSLNHE